MTDVFKAVEIEINHGCNMACSYCPNSIDDRIEKGQMSQEIFERVVSELKKISFAGRISFDFYNEPMLSSHLISFIRDARRELPMTSIELYSNGTMLTVDIYRELIKAGVSKFIITKHESADSNYIFDKTFALLSDDEKKILFYRLHTDIQKTNRGGLIKDIGSDVSTAFMPCHLPDQMLTITVKGNVVPCFEDFYQKNQMGNIMEESLMDIWTSAKYREFRSFLRRGLRHKFEACRTCSRLEVL